MDGYLANGYNAPLAGWLCDHSPRRHTSIDKNNLLLIQILENKKTDC